MCLLFTWFHTYYVGEMMYRSEREKQANVQEFMKIINLKAGEVYQCELSKKDMIKKPVIKKKILPRKTCK